MRKVGIILLVIGVIAAVGGYYMLQQANAESHTAKGAVRNALDWAQGGEEFGQKARVSRTAIAGGIGVGVIGLLLTLFGTRKLS